MPPDEGLALFEAGCDAGSHVPGAPFVEVGSYCGKSSIYLGEAARQRQTVLFAVDHHRGSEEDQDGWEHHDPDVVDVETGLMDTLPWFRRSIHAAGLDHAVIAVVGDSVTVAAFLSTPAALVFIDGGHGSEPAHADYEAWSRRVALGGYLAIPDVFPDPKDGGRPPFEIYQRALKDGLREVSATRPLRVPARPRP